MQDNTYENDLKGQYYQLKSTSIIYKMSYISLKS